MNGCVFIVAVALAFMLDQVGSCLPMKPGRMPSPGPCDHVKPSFCDFNSNEMCTDPLSKDGGYRCVGAYSVMYINGDPAKSSCPPSGCTDINLIKCVYDTLLMEYAFQFDPQTYMFTLTKEDRVYCKTA